VLNYLNYIFENALKNFDVPNDIQLYFEEPKNPEHGDFSTNIAMKLAKPMKQSPRSIADLIICNLEIDRKYINEVSIAGAGFVNIKCTNEFWTNSLSEMLKSENNFGKHKIGKNKKANIEYVSVNPTGLLHIGHGRNACIGDTIANLYQWLGYDVTREYYFNNAGNQMKVLTDSIYARYMQIVDNKDYPFPENGYHGYYVSTIASELANQSGKEYIEGTFQDLTQIRKFGEGWCFAQIKKTLNRINIRQDDYFNEDSLYKNGKIQEVITAFKDLGLAYEKDGALWLALSKMGLEDDRVIVKSSGEPTYRLPDIAYHREKFERGFDVIVDLFGADHIATIPDVLAGLKALSYDPDKVKVLIHQFVTLTENGEQIKMSKRTGKSYTLDDLLDEVGPDVVRFFLLMRSINTHLEFDLTLAKEQSDKNPVFYLQYAYARICSIFDKVSSEGIEYNYNSDLKLLEHTAEIDLIRRIMKFPDIVLVAASKCEPHIIAEYLKEVAAAFHTFYHDCRIIGSSSELLSARLSLCNATKYILASGLNILGINTPERM